MPPLASVTARTGGETPSNGTMSIRQPGAPGGALAEGDITPGHDDRTADTGIAKRLKRTIRRVALCDASQIEAHTLPGERERAPRGIERHQPKAHDPTGVCKLLRVGPLALPAGVAPQFRQRTDGHVERAARAFRECLTADEHIEHIRAERHGMAPGFGACTHQLAVVAIVGQTAVEVCDRRERGIAAARRRFLVWRVENDPEGRSHVLTAELVAAQEARRCVKRGGAGERRHHEHEENCSRRATMRSDTSEPPASRADARQTARLHGSATSCRRSRGSQRAAPASVQTSASRARGSHRRPRADRM